MKNNTLAFWTIVFNVVKDLGTVGIFGWLSAHFNNIWIMLFALLFIGGYNLTWHEGDEKKDDK